MSIGVADKERGRQGDTERKRGGGAAGPFSLVSPVPCLLVWFGSGAGQTTSPHPPCPPLRRGGEGARPCGSGAHFSPSVSSPVFELRARQTISRDPAAPPCEGGGRRCGPAPRPSPLQGKKLRNWQFLPVVVDCLW